MLFYIHILIYIHIYGITRMENDWYFGVFLRFFFYVDHFLRSFSIGSDSKESACNAGDRGSNSGSGRRPGGGNGNPLQYSCLENSLDTGACWVTVRGITESDTTEQLTYVLRSLLIVL